MSPLHFPRFRPRSRGNAVHSGLFALAVAGACLAVPGAPAAQQPSSTGAQATPTLASKIGAQVKELKKIDVKQGAGAEAVPGKSVIVHYTGWLYDPAAADGHGAKVDSSVDRKSPFVLMLGAKMVIRGWDEGVAGMKVGGKRTLVIPPQMAYGERGAAGVIPPNATLVFDVELLDVKS